MIRAGAYIALIATGTLLLVSCSGGSENDIADTKIGACQAENIEGFNCECLETKLAEGQHDTVKTLLDDLAKTTPKKADKKGLDVTQADINALINLADYADAECEF